MSLLVTLRILALARRAARRTDKKTKQDYPFTSLSSLHFPKKSLFLRTTSLDNGVFDLNLTNFRLNFTPLKFDLGKKHN